VPQKRSVVAADQAGRVSRVLRTHVRPAQGAERGARVSGRGMRALAVIAALCGALAGVVRPALAQTSTSPVVDPSLIEAARASSSTGTAMPATSTLLPPLPGAVDPETYRVGPGDVLQLSMSGKVSRTESLEIGPEGTVLIPGVDVIDLRGLTLAD